MAPLIATLYLPGGIPVRLNVPLAVPGRAVSVCVCVNSAAPGIRVAENELDWLGGIGCALKRDHAGDNPARDNLNAIDGGARRPATEGLRVQGKRILPGHRENHVIARARIIRVG